MVPITTKSKRLAARVRTAVVVGQESDAAAVHAVLASLEQEYPGFARWYWDKVVPGMGSDRMIVTATSGGETLGVGIFKRGAEAKLCTLWVDDRLRGRGVGGSIVEEGIAWMGTETPLATIGQARLGMLAGLIARYPTWRVTEAAQSLYKPGETEFVINGLVAPNGSVRAGR